MASCGFLFRHGRLWRIDAAATKRDNQSHFTAKRRQWQDRYGHLRPAMNGVDGHFAMAQRSFYEPLPGNNLAKVVVLAHKVVLENASSVTEHEEEWAVEWFAPLQVPTWLAKTASRGHIDEMSNMRTHEKGDRFFYPLNDSHLEELFDYLRYSCFSTSRLNVWRPTSRKVSCETMAALGIAAEVTTSFDLFSLTDVQRYFAMATCPVSPPPSKFLPFDSGDMIVKERFNKGVRPSIDYLCSHWITDPQERWLLKLPRAGVSAKLHAALAPRVGGADGRPLFLPRDVAFDDVSCADTRNVIYAAVVDRCLCSNVDNALRTVFVLRATCREARDAITTQIAVAMKAVLVEMRSEAHPSYSSSAHKQRTAIEQLVRARCALEAIHVCPFDVHREVEACHAAWTESSESELLYLFVRVRMPLRSCLTPARPAMPQSIDDYRFVRNVPGTSNQHASSSSSSSSSSSNRALRRSARNGATKVADNRRRVCLKARGLKQVRRSVLPAEQVEGVKMAAAWYARCGDACGARPFIRVKLRLGGRVGYTGGFVV